MDRIITPEQADFVAAKTKELFDYTTQCFDRARSEGNNVLQWLFGMITGGMAAAGALHSHGLMPFAVGAVVAVGAAACVTGHFKTSHCGSIQNQPPCEVGFQGFFEAVDKLAAASAAGGLRVAASLSR